MATETSPFGRPPDGPHGGPSRGFGERPHSAAAVLPRAPLVVEAKLRPPVVRDEVLPRPALRARLDDAAARGLTLVVAPAGYGKTTTLAGWVHGRSDVAWIAVDERDREPARLAAHLVAAVERVVPAAGAAAWPALLAGADPATDVMPLLTNALHGEPVRGVTLVLDDGHLLEDTPAGDAVRVLLQTAPPALHVVVASRHGVPVPLTRRRAARTLTEIGPDDLRLTADEVSELVNDRLGLSLSPDQTRRLATTTEGWPAAVSLAALRGAEGSRALVRTGTAPDEIVEYLVQEVLAGLDEPMRAFLRRTSILPVLHADLCCAVLDDPDADVLLRRARRFNLLLMPADGGSARCHALLRDLLAAGLRRREPDLVPTLHRRAGAWLARDGQHEQAIEHAILAGDAPWAIELLIEISADLLLARRYDAIVSILDRLPGDAGPRTEWVETMRLVCDSLNHGIGGTGRRRIRELAARGAAPRLLGILRRSYVCGDVRDALEVIDDDEDDRADPRLRYVAATQRAMLWWAVGDPRLPEALAVPPPPGGADLTMRVWHHWLLAFSALDDGRADDALVHSRDAVAEVERHGSGRAASFALAHLSHAASLIAVGRHGEAEPPLAHAESITSRVPDGVPHMLTLVVRARLELVRGRRDDAAPRVSAARAILDDCVDLGRLGRWVEDVERLLAESWPPESVPTPAERRVLALLVTDSTATEIGAALFISRNTVRTHTRNLYRRLGVSTRADAVAAARARGLL